MLHRLNILIFPCFFFCGFGFSQDTITIPPHVKTALEINAVDLNPVSLVWQSTYSTDFELKELCNLIGADGIFGFNEPTNQVYMWQEQRFFERKSHKELLGPDQNKDPLPKPWELAQDTPLFERVLDVSFDGEKVFQGNGIFIEKDSQALLINDLDHFKNDDYPIIIQQYTNHVGFKFPNKPSEFHDLPVSLVLFLIDKGELLDIKSEKLAGYDALQLKIKSDYLLFPWQNPNRNYCFWLVPDLNYAVKQIDILRENDKLAYRIINDNFEKLSKKSVYIPRNTVLEHYTSESSRAKISPTVLYKEIFTLVEISSKRINTAQFDLQNLYSKPGIRVANYVLSDKESGLQYDIPANPADLDRVIEAALTGKDFVPTPLPSRAASIFRWILLLAGIAMIVYACYVKLVKKKG